MINIIFKKTIYDPEVISDDEFIKRGIEAAGDVWSILPREWFGVDKILCDKYVKNDFEQVSIVNGLSAEFSNKFELFL